MEPVVAVADVDTPVDVDTLVAVADVDPPVAVANVGPPVAVADMVAVADVNPAVAVANVGPPVTMLKTDPPFTEELTDAPFTVAETDISAPLYVTVTWGDTVTFIITVVVHDGQTLSNTPLFIPSP